MPDFLWNRNDGAVSLFAGGKTLVDEVAIPPDRVPDGLVLSAVNVDLVDHYICRPRRGMAALATTGSPPTTFPVYLFSQRSSSFPTSSTAPTIAETLWVFATDGSAAMTAHSFNGTTWTSHTLPDTATAYAQPHCVQYNGKLFAAYNSGSNRLHVYDGSSWRRVGIAASAAATVADTGSGSYAATIRYYKVQFRIKSGSAVIASSELSPVVSFTPSGSGASARVTKPTTPDSATHWTVHGSADGTTFYEVSGDIAVGTTTWDDGTDPAVYNQSPVSPVDAGLYVPPPSARFLCTDGTRLLMAGSFETSASSGETTPSDKRVWFTRPLGATDQGDDESITQTSTSRYYIDIDDETNDTITGLASINGVVYVFFPQAVWRLIPTGQSDSPYRAEKLSGTAGAASQYAIAVAAQADDAEDAIYAIAERTGFHRISLSGGVEWLGTSLVPRSLPSTLSDVRLAYEPGRRDLWITLTYNSGDPVTGVIDLARFRRYGQEFYGGMRVFSPPTTSTVRVVGDYGQGVALGVSNTPPVGFDTYAIYELDEAATGDSGSAFTATVFGPGISTPTRRVDLSPPVLRTGTTGGNAGDVTVSFYDYHVNPIVLNGRTLSVTAHSNGFGVAVRVDGLEMADASVPFPVVSLTSTSAVTAVESLVVPYTVKEPL